MNKLISGPVLAATAIVVVGLVPRVVLAESKVRELTYLVKQDHSDCTNSDVKPAQPAVLGGEAMVTRRDGDKTEVNVRLTKVAPNTTYHLFLKCHYTLGNITTDGTERGTTPSSFRRVMEVPYSRSTCIPTAHRPETNTRVCRSVFSSATRGRVSPSREAYSGWLVIHESGTYVKFTQAGAELFA